MNVVKDTKETKHTVTQEVLNYIDRMAKKLPPVKRRINGQVVVSNVRVKESGENLLAGGVKMHYDKIVASDETYIMRKPQYENHFQNMIEAYREKGNEGITDYLNKMHLQAWRDLSLIQKFKAVVSKIKSLIKQTNK